MAEVKKETNRSFRLRHKGRDSQTRICLGKQFRFFINESDWKVLPMAAIIAAMVGMVIHEDFFVNMEGCLIGAFALTSMAIWNGCFNSIQTVCRERPIVKREHRSGMHISSYIAAHMIYQFLLCAVQTALTMYMLALMGVQFPEKGIITPWMIVDIGITMLLITYASDMMSLFISSVTHTTTGAMTIMPFVLIFQLVFSGGFMPLPEWSKSVCSLTLSSYGVNCIAAQAGYNEAPMVTAWKTLDGMKDKEFGGTFTLGQIMDLLDTPAVESRRDTEVIKAYTVGEAADILNQAAEALRRREAEDSAQSVDIGEIVKMLQMEDAVEQVRGIPLNTPVTLGDVADFVKNNEILQAQRDRDFTVKIKVSDLFDLLGEENIKDLVQRETADAAWVADYEQTPQNIANNWVYLGLFILAFSALSMLMLELIDKDKR